MGSDNRNSINERNPKPIYSTMQKNIEELTRDSHYLPFTRTFFISSSLPLYSLWTEQWPHFNVRNLTKMWKQTIVLKWFDQISLSLVIWIFSLSTNLAYYQVLLSHSAINGQGNFQFLFFVFQFSETLVWNIYGDDDEVDESFSNKLDHHI